MRATVLTRALFFVIADTVISFFTLYMAYLLRFNFHIPEPFFPSFFKIYALLTLLKILLFSLFGIYRFSWRFFGIYEAWQTVKALSGAYFLAILILFSFRDYFGMFPRSAILIDFFLSLVALLGFRFLKRIYLEMHKKESIEYCAIYGLTSKTKQLINSYHNGELGCKPVVIIDDKKRGTIFGGIEVVDEERFIANFPHISTLIIAQDMPKEQLERITKKLHTKHIKIASLYSDQIKELQIEDLLARKPKDLDKEAIKRFMKGKKVLITGAGGSIGSELVKQSLHFGAKSIIAVEASEYNLYKLTEQFPSIEPKLLNILDREAFEEVMEKERPDIVLHAAAYKHVPLAELNPKACAINNILGTKNSIDLSIKYGVDHFVLISTDKAVNPTNIMGATKRVCELYAQNVKSADTTICAVRFGNVLGSSGSVIPKFKAQIEKGGPITITHPDITRYFMLVSEACQLVLQAAAISKGREIFILDMGKPVKIVDLAKLMMRLYGKEVPIQYIGLRPGEKLFEELIVEGAEQKTRYQSIFIAKATPFDIELLDREIGKIENAKDEEIAKILQKIVKEFHHTPHR